MRKIRKLVMDKKGMSYPLTVALVLALLIALCVLAEFFRLSIIAYHVKWQGNGYEYRVTDLNVSISNAPFAPGNASQNFEADVSVQLEIPLSFGWEALPPVRMTIRAKAAYMPKF